MTTKSHTKDAWELHATLRRVFENHCSTCNTNHASYNRTTLQMIETRKHQRLADPLLQSGVITHNYLSNGYSFTSGLVQTELWLLIFNLSSDSWFLICTPAPCKMPNSSAPVPLLWNINKFMKNKLNWQLCETVWTTMKRSRDWSIYAQKWQPCMIHVCLVPAFVVFNIFWIYAYLKGPGYLKGPS